MFDFFNDLKRRKICLIQTNSFIFAKTKFLWNFFIFEISKYSFTFTKKKFSRKFFIFEISKYSFIFMKNFFFFMFEIFVYFCEKEIFFHVRNIRLFSRKNFFFSCSKYSFIFAKKFFFFMFKILVYFREKFFFFHVRNTRLFSRKKNSFSYSKYSFIFAKKKFFFMFEIFVYFREKETPFHARNIRLFLRKKNLHEIFENSCLKYFDITINLYESSNKKLIIIEKFFNQKQLYLRISYTIDENRMNKKNIMKLSRKNKIMNINSVGLATVNWVPEYSDAYNAIKILWWWELIF